MEEFAIEDQSNYYSGITCVMVNGKRAYELKGKFLDDLRDNAFSGTNGEDVIEHIEYFLKIVDLINLPNVNHERIRLAIFSISLVGNASKWFDEFKGSFTTWVDLTKKNFGKYYPLSCTGRIMVTKPIRVPNNSTDDQDRVVDEGFSNVQEANNDDEQEIAEIFRTETNLFDNETSLCTEFKEFNSLLKVDPELFTHDIERTKTNKYYGNELNDKHKEPWSEGGVPYEMCAHIWNLFVSKMGKLNGPLAIQMKMDSVTEESYQEWFGLVTRHIFKTINGTDNEENDEKQSQSDKTRLEMEKTVKDKPNQSRKVNQVKKST
ncbi:hypothetical protein Tco_1322235 [Tanacetum coccineum]